MIHRRLLVALALLAAIFGCGIARSAPAATPATDKAQVVAAVLTMYDALKTDDLAKFHATVALGFYAFDEGKRFDGDALAQRVKSLHAQGYVFKRSVTRADVHVRGDTAWITYTNRGSIGNKSGTKPATWLESAFLQKERGRWRIVFFHSTEVPGATQ